MSLFGQLRRWSQVGAVVACSQLAILASSTSEAGANQAPASSAATGKPSSLIDDEAAARRAESISNSLMSPFCPGRTLSGCPSPNATAWRSDIRQWVDEGLSAEEIEQRLSQRLPDFNLRGSPETALGRWIAVFLGVGALAVLAGILRLTTGRGRRKAEASPSGGKQPKAKPKKPKPASTPATDGELEERLKNELEALD